MRSGRASQGLPAIVESDRETGPATSPGTSAPSRPLPAVPTTARGARAPIPLWRPAARKAIRQRMLLLRSASVERVRSISGTDGARLRAIRQELVQGELPDQLLSRGAGVAFVREFPHGALLYLLVRALRPGRVVETGVRPGYTTMWILGALAANGRGELTSLGPGSPAGRAAGVQDVPVGQFVAPALRDRWTLALGNTPEHLDRILDEGPPVDLFLHDNGSEADRTRSELHSAWTHLGPRGVLLAHRIDANPVWEQFCRMQGVADGVLDPGPPPIGALTVRRP